jgi:RNA polymerase sigma-70 factor (ECF subfamily)
MRPAQDAPASLSLAAFTEVVDRLQPDLSRFLSHLVRDQEQARDLLQDTFSAAWRMVCEQVPPFVAESDEEQIRRWLFRVAYHNGVAVLRRRRLIRWESWERLVEMVGEWRPATPSFEERVVEADALRWALAQLTPQDRACLLLQVEQGLSLAEIGHTIGTSAEVARKRLSRAKQRFRRIYRAPVAHSEE